MTKAPFDTLVQKKVARDAGTRLHRRRLCWACASGVPRVIGTVHSDLACDACGVAPCYGVIVQGNPAT